jgi:hypothetical protein
MQNKTVKVHEDDFLNPKGGSKDVVEAKGVLLERQESAFRGPHTKVFLKAV